MVNAAIKPLLDELREGLARLYGDRLVGVYLFGSYSRGEQDEESDLDVLIVLDRIQNYGGEIDFTGELISEVSLRNNVSVSRKFVAAEDWKDGDTLFLRNVREDAVAI